MDLKTRDGFILINNDDLQTLQSIALQLKEFKRSVSFYHTLPESDPRPKNGLSKCWRLSDDLIVCINKVCNIQPKEAEHEQHTNVVTG